MFKNAIVVFCLLIVCHARPGSADVVCPDSSYVEVVFNRIYPDDSQFAGQPYDYVTVTPDGSGESFANVNGFDENDGLLDISVRVYLRNCQGEPCVGIPAERIILSSPTLCICPGGADADAGTDANGVATFTGTLGAGGCATSIEVYADDMFIGTLMDASGRTVKINSTDPAYSSPCFTDAGDLAGIAAMLGRSASGGVGRNLHECFDYNERGAYIDASDLAAFAFALNAACQ